MSLRLLRQWKVWGYGPGDVFGQSKEREGTYKGRRNKDEFYGEWTRDLGDHLRMCKKFWAELRGEETL